MRRKRIFSSFLLENSMNTCITQANEMRCMERKTSEYRGGKQNNFYK